MAGAREFARLHSAVAAGGGQMVGHRLTGGRFHVGLSPGAAAGGGRMHPPVVQHLRDMHRLGGRVAALHFIDKPQEKVMILGAVTRRALAAHGFEQFFFEHRQMADVVDGHQVFRRVVGLEVAHAGVFGGFLKQGLVAVGEVRAGLSQQLAHAVDGVRSQHVIMVGQRQVGAGGQLGGLIGVGGDALIFNLAVDNARVGCRAGLHGALHVGVSRIAGIDQHQLPVGGRLALHAVQKLLQELRRCIVQRRQNADSRPVFGVLPGVRTLGVQRLLGGQVAGLFAEEPPLKEPCCPGRHHTDALFLRQGARIAEQFLDAFRFQAHGGGSL